jgi:hypothetical protein
VAVKILASPVVTHRRPRVGMARSDMDIPQVHASVEHGGHEWMAEHVRVRSGNPNAGGFGEPPEAAGGGRGGPSGHRGC